MGTFSGKICLKKDASPQGQTDTKPVDLMSCAVQHIRLADEKLADVVTSWEQCVFVMQ